MLSFIYFFWHDNFLQTLQSFQAFHKHFIGVMLTFPQGNARCWNNSGMLSEFSLVHTPRGQSSQVLAFMYGSLVPLTDLSSSFPHWQQCTSGCWVNPKNLTVMYQFGMSNRIMYSKTCVKWPSSGVCLVLLHKIFHYLAGVVWANSTWQSNLHRIPPAFTPTPVSNTILLLQKVFNS